MEKITADRAKQLLIYDPVSGVLTRKERPRSDFSSLNAFAVWNSRNAGNQITAIDEEGYVFACLDGCRYRAHRIIWLMVHGRWPTVIDHQDGCRSNNALSNLREVTVRENNRNRGIRSDNTSGVPGVYKRGERWQASIRCDGKSRSLGFFDTIQQASDARKAAEAKLGFHPNHGRVVQAA
jgi:hypothetical protein